jgi:Tfp pilus assembly protein PilE
MASARQRGFTLTDLIAGITSLGVLASAGVLQFEQAIWRAHQAEAKNVLLGYYHAEQMYYASNDAYCSDMTLVGYQVKRGNRYTYDFGINFNYNPRGFQDRSTATLDTTTHYSGFSTDTYYWPNLNPRYTPGSGADVDLLTTEPGHQSLGQSFAGWYINGTGQPGVAPCTNSTGDFMGTAITNLDDDFATLDEWAISTQGGVTNSLCSESNGVSFLPGQPVNFNDDVVCN